MNFAKEWLRGCAGPFTARARHHLDRSNSATIHAPGGIVIPKAVVRLPDPCISGSSPAAFALTEFSEPAVPSAGFLLPSWSAWAETAPAAPRVGFGLTGLPLGVVSPSSKTDGIDARACFVMATLQNASLAHAPRPDRRLVHGPHLRFVRLLHPAVIGEQAVVLALYIRNLRVYRA